MTLGVDFDSFFSDDFTDFTYWGHSEDDKCQERVDPPEPLAFDTSEGTQYHAYISNAWANPKRSSEDSRALLSPLVPSSAQTFSKLFIPSSQNPQDSSESTPNGLSLFLKELFEGFPATEAGRQEGHSALTTQDLQPDFSPPIQYTHSLYSDVPYSPNSTSLPTHDTLPQVTLDYIKAQFETLNFRLNTVKAFFGVVCAREQQSYVSLVNTVIALDKKLALQLLNSLGVLRNIKTLIRIDEIINDADYPYQQHAPSGSIHHLKEKRESKEVSLPQHLEETVSTSIGSFCSHDCALDGKLKDGFETASTWSALSQEHHDREELGQSILNMFDSGSAAAMLSSRELMMANNLCKQPAGLGKGKGVVYGENHAVSTLQQCLSNNWDNLPFPKEWMDYTFRYASNLDKAAQLKFLASANVVGKLFDCNGENIRMIQLKYKVRISTSGNRIFYPGTGKQVLLMRGKMTDILYAMRTVFVMMIPDIVDVNCIPPNFEPAAIKYELCLVIPSTASNKLLSSRGTHIQWIQNQTKGRIHVTCMRFELGGVQERLATISGSLTAVEQAVELIALVVQDDPIGEAYGFLNYPLYTKAHTN